MLLVIMSAIIILFVFPKENVSASPYLAVHASPEGERNILAATFQLRIFNAEGTFYEEGIATLVRHHEQRLLLTHNHWSYLPSCSTIEFLNAKSHPLMTLNCSALKYLIVFGDSGVLVLKAPESLGGRPAALGSIQDALPGQSVIIVHQNSIDRSKVRLIPGEIRFEDSFEQLPVLRLDVSAEELIKGDSGGGIWIDGRLVGNLWANTYERKSGPTFLWEFSEIPIAATIPLENIEMATK
jgi:hypothetical protein